MTPEERAAKVVTARADTFTLEQLIARAIREAVKAEREACAKVAAAHKYLGGDGKMWCNSACLQIADMIRARGEHKAEAASGA